MSGGGRWRGAEPRLPAAVERLCGDHVRAGRREPAVDPAVPLRRAACPRSEGARRPRAASRTSVRQTEKRGFRAGRATSAPARAARRAPSITIGRCAGASTAAIFGRGGVRSSLIVVRQRVRPALVAQRRPARGSVLGRDEVLVGPAVPRERSARPCRAACSSRCARPSPPSSSRIVTVTSAASGSLKRILRRVLDPVAVGRERLGARAVAQERRLLLQRAAPRRTRRSLRPPAARIRPLRAGLAQKAPARARLYGGARQRRREAGGRRARRPRPKHSVSSPAASKAAGAPPGEWKAGHAAAHQRSRPRQPRPRRPADASCSSPGHAKLACGRAPKL